MAQQQTEVIVAEVRDLARGSARIAEIVAEAEKRHGDLSECLDALEWVSSDTAYLTHVQKDGTASKLPHNVMPGQLVYALERGFLPIPLAKWQALNPVPELVAAGDVRNAVDERLAQLELKKKKKIFVKKTEEGPTKADLTCVECDRLFSTARGISMHKRQPGHIRRVAELAMQQAEQSARPEA